MRQITMLTKGPNKNYKVGAKVEVDDTRAAALVKEKHAKYAGKK